MQFSVLLGWKLRKHVFLRRRPISFSAGTSHSVIGHVNRGECFIFHGGILTRDGYTWYELQNVHGHSVSRLQSPSIIPFFTYFDYHSFFLSVLCGGPALSFYMHLLFQSSGNACTITFHYFLIVVSSPFYILICIY